MNAEEPQTPQKQAINQANEFCKSMGAKKAVPASSKDAHGTMEYGSSTEKQQLGTRNHYKGGVNIKAAEGSYNRDGEQKNTTNQADVRGSFNFKCE